MGPQIVILGSGILFMLAVIHLLLKKRSNVGYSLIWLGLALVSIIIGIFPVILYVVCSWFNIGYQPTLAMVATILFLLIFVFYLSSEISVAKSKISELSMQISLLNNDIVELKEDLKAGKYK